MQQLTGTLSKEFSAGARFIERKGGGERSLIFLNMIFDGNFNQLVVR